MSILDEARKEAERERKKKRTGPAPSENGQTFVPGEVNYTDLGNARRLVSPHGQDFRHCFPWKEDLVWVGTHWSEDDTGQVERWAKDTVRRMLMLAAASEGA